MKNIKKTEAGENILLKELQLNGCVTLKEAIEKCLNSDSEVVYALVNYTALFSTQNILLEMSKEKEEEK